MGSMRRGGIDLSIADWTPPWEYVPDANPSPDHPNTHGYIPVFFSHPIYDPTAAERPVASQMDSPVFPDYHAQTTGIFRAGIRTENPRALATADDFYRPQLTRGAGCEAGTPGQVPHYGYLPAPMGQ
eukprot:2364921-Pyramimonas_sp.AAC.1